MLLNYIGKDYYNSVCERAREEDELLFSQRLPLYHIHALRMIEHNNLFSITAPIPVSIQHALSFPKISNRSSLISNMML